MLISRHFKLTSIASAIFLAMAAAAFADDGAPLQWVPPSCNAVAVIHMRKLVNSPMGKKQKWSDKVRRAYAEGLLSAPPWVKEAVRATTFGSMSAGRPLSYSIFAMDQQSILGDIARHERASSEKIGGSFACLSPRGIYFVQLAPGVLGAVQPPDRRAVSAWVRTGTASNESNLSPFLKTALDTTDDALIVIAVDLTDMLNPPQVRAWLAASPRLKVRKNLDEMAALVASIRGARLSVNVTDTANAQARPRFRQADRQSVAAAGGRAAMARRCGGSDGGDCAGADVRSKTNRLRSMRPWTTRLSAVCSA